MPLTVAQLVARLTADTSGFYRSMAIANSSMLRTGGIISRVTAGAGLAVLGMGIVSVRAAGNFQQSMNILQAVTDATGGQMKQLSDRAISLGADLKLPNVSAKDAADAMVELSKGGLSVNRVLQATRGTLQLGLAANIQFGEAAQFTARALKAFGLAGADAGRVANVLAATANKSTAEFSDLTYGFQNAASQFKATGQSVEDLSASLGIMADHGINGEQAGTALKTMLIRLTSPTNKARDVLDSLGISLFNSRGEMLKMPAIIGQFQKGMHGLTMEQREQALTTIFGVRANSAMRVLLGEGEQGYLKFRDAVTGTNAAQKLAEARTKGFNGALQGFTSVVETLAIQLGTALLPPLTSAIQWMSRFVQSVDPQRIIAFFGAIKDGVVWIYNLISGSDLATAAVGALVAGFIAFKIVSGAIELATAAMVIFNAVVSANPVVLAVAAVVALAAGLFILYQRSETVRAIIDSIWAALTQRLGPAFQAIGAFAQRAGEFIKQAFDNLLSWFRANQDAFKADAQAIWVQISAIFRTAMAVITAVFSAAWPVIVAMARASWNTIKAVVQMAMELIKGIINIVMGVIKGDWGRAWEGIKQVAHAAIVGVANIVKTEIEGLATVIVAAAEAVGKAIINGIKAGFMSGVGALKGAMEGALKSVVDNLNPFSPPQHGGEIIGEAMGRGTIIGWLNGTVDLPKKISDTLRNALDAGKRVVDEKKGELSTAFSQLAGDVTSAFDAVTQQHKTKSQKLLDALVSQHDADEFNARLNKAKQDYADALAAFAAFEQDPTMGGKLDATEQAAKQKELGQAVLGAQKENADLEYQQRVAALTAQAAEEDKQYTAQRGLQKRHLDQRLTELEAGLAKHPEREKYYQEQIIKLLNSYGVSYKSSGLALGNAFAEGMRESIGSVRSAAEALAHAIESVLKLHSPAQEGPFHDLDTWWRGFAPALLSSLDSGAIYDALLGALAPGGASAGMPSGAAYTRTSAGATGGALITIQNPTFLTGDRRTARDFVESIREFLPEPVGIG